MQKILIIEDSKLITMHIARFLKSKYSLASAINAAVGITKLTSYKPDCILSDLQMPEMDGYQFLEYMQKENIKIPVIIMSSDIQDSDKERCYSLGAFDILNKPLQEEILLNIIRKALEGITG